MIEGAEWLIVVIALIAFLYCCYLVLSVEGDLDLDLKHGINSDSDAARLFVDLVNYAKSSIVIREDGDSSDSSIYNDEEVLNAIRKRLVEFPELEFKCLFNEEANLQLLNLVDKEHPENFKIWYAKGYRPTLETHYKVIDDGYVVFLSRYKRGDKRRPYVQRRIKWALAKGSRKRNAERYLSHFTEGCSNATMREVRSN